MSVTGASERATPQDLTQGLGNVWVGLTSLGRADPKDFAWDGTNETVGGNGYANWCYQKICGVRDDPAGDPCGYVSRVNGLWATASCDSFKLSWYLVEYDCD
jgi:hypothetical protein